MGVLSNLDPQRVFDYFEKLCSVPHGSGNTKQISDLCASFAEHIGLKYVQDELNNLVIYKPAAPGYEDHEPIILQGHMDMVCAKTADCTKDMSKEGLDLYIEDGYVRARNTSLGGDDGIAVAIILALLEDRELKAPAIEAVFTVDEEVGMDGAAGLDMSLLSAGRMLNLDSEEEGVFTVSCAGGLRADCFIPSNTSSRGSVPSDNLSDDDSCICVLRVDGLIGGHSGCEIDKGRQNAIKLMARILGEVRNKKISYRLTGLEGGRFDNVICDQAQAVISVKRTDVSVLEDLIVKLSSDFKKEFASTDPGVNVSCCSLSELNKDNTEMDASAFVHSVEDSYRFVDALNELPQGIVKMSPDIEGLVQTSLNAGVVRLEKDGLKFTVSVRSSVSDEKYRVADTLRGICGKYSGEVSIRGDYPGWAYKEDSTVRNVLAAVYKEQTGREPVITAIHAGLECGLFAEAISGFDCVSIGPELRSIHSVGEKLGISSVKRLYSLVRDFLMKM